MSVRQSITGAVNRLLAPFGAQICGRLPSPASATAAAGAPRARFPIFLPYPVDPRPRYGHGLPPHAGICSVLATGRRTYVSHLKRFLELKEQLHSIPETADEDADTPCWSNPWFRGLDIVALYSFIALTRPARYLEIGSGCSTKVARRAVAHHATGTQITSIDPEPRASIDHLADRVIRRPLEQVPLTEFDSLGPGDIVFFDGSHRCFMGSDVTVFFLEVLPRIAPGVLVQIHDIHLPNDYPPIRARHYESEQYLLAAMLLSGMTRFEVELPNRYVVDDKELGGVLTPLWDLVGDVHARRGTSFWMRTRDDRPAASATDMTRGEHVPT